VLEGMQNVAKYANASNTVVRLRPERDALAFSVADDGQGFQKGTTSFGMGLQNIADRLAALGGTFDVRSAPGEGTTVSGRIPAVAEP
jgi:signal transduction histidine kinase